MSLPTIDSSDSKLQTLAVATQALQSFSVTDQNLRDKVVSAIAQIGIAPAAESSARPVAAKVSEEERLEVHNRFQRLWDSAVAAAPGDTRVADFRERMNALRNPLHLNLEEPAAAAEQAERTLPQAEFLAPEIEKQKASVVKMLEPPTVRGRIMWALLFSLSPATAILDMAIVLLLPIGLALAVVGLVISPVTFVVIQIRCWQQNKLKAAIEQDTTTEELAAHWKSIASHLDTKQQKELISSLGPDFVAALLEDREARKSIIGKFKSFGDQTQEGERRCSNTQLTLLRAGGPEFQNELAQKYTSDQPIKILCGVLGVFEDKDANPDQIRQALGEAEGVYPFCDLITPSLQEVFCRCQDTTALQQNKWAVPYPNKWLPFWERVPEERQTALLASIRPPQRPDGPGHPRYLEHHTAQEFLAEEYLSLFSPDDTKCSKKQMLLLMSRGIGGEFFAAVKKRASRFSTLCDAVAVIRDPTSSHEARTNARVRLNADRAFTEPFFTVYPKPEELPATPPTDLTKNPFV